MQYCYNNKLFLCRTLKIVNILNKKGYIYKISNVKFSRFKLKILTLSYTKKFTTIKLLLFPQAIKYLKFFSLVFCENRYSLNEVQMQVS